MGEGESEGEVEGEGEGESGVKGESEGVEARMWAGWWWYGR